MTWAKGPCPACGSPQACTTYDDGHSYCFSCQAYTAAAGGSSEHKEEGPKREGDYLPLTDRGISRDIAELYQVKSEISPTTGETSKHYYPYYNEDDVRIGWKIRVVDGKRFSVEGSLKKAKLFGQNVRGGKKLLVITEGEADAMAAKQMLRAEGKDYSVVSIPNGAASTQALKDNLEWVESFESIILCYDNDEAGIRGVDTATPLFTIGKVKVARLPSKDANEMLHEGMSKEFLQALWSASVKRPDGIVELGDGWDTLFDNDGNLSIPFMWDGLNEKLYGMRDKEIITLTAGSGIGKSSIAKEMVYHLLKTTNDNIGVLALEESIEYTKWSFISMEANLPLTIREERAGVDKEKVRGWFDATMGTGRMFALDHFGSTGSDSLLSKIRFLIKAYDCKWILLDHLSIIVSSMDESSDERKLIDKLMTQLRTLVEETGVGMLLVVHLNRPPGGKGHEQGLEVSLSHLRGSQSIAQLSDVVIAGERNQQDPDPVVANTTYLRVLKNRYAGKVGLATALHYDETTGRLVETTIQNEADKEDF